MSFLRMKHEISTGEEEEVFLEKSEQGDSIIHPETSRRHSQQRLWASIFHLTVAIVWTTAATIALKTNDIRFNDSISQVHDAPALFQMPHDTPLVYLMERRPGEGPGGSPYAGKPRPGLDQAWHDLLKYSNIRLSLEELDFLDPARKDSAVELPDGGYYATTQVMHELHCIKHLHRNLWPETYFPELSTAQLEDQKIHVEHCLDTLRQGVMCRADLTPITMRWGHKQPVPLGNFSSPHQCVDWSRVDYWMQDRSIDDIFRPGYLQHPVLGEVYTEENQENAEITGTVHDD